MNRASINFWQDENLFGQVRRKPGWMITTSNPMRKEYRQRESWSGRQSGMRGQWWAEMLGFTHTQLKTGTWQAGSATLAKSSGGSSEKAREHIFCSWFTCPEVIKSRHWQSRQLLIAEVTPPPVSPSNGQTASKEDVKVQEVWWDSPSHQQHIPSFPQQEQKNWFSVALPWTLLFFHRGPASPSSSKWSNSALSLGQVLFPRWKPRVWVRALLYCIGPDWLQLPCQWEDTCMCLCLSCIPLLLGKQL